jgi:hypothetical protein
MKRSHSITVLVSSIVCGSVACGAKSVYLDRGGSSSAGESGVQAGVELIAPGAHAFLANQASAVGVLVDDKRVYWYTATPTGGTAVLRSCAKASCESTLVTYDSITRNDTTGFGSGPYRDVVLDGANIYWQKQAWVSEVNDPSPLSTLHVTVNSCPLEGCNGKATSLGNFAFSSSRPPSSIAVDDQFLYWTSPADSGVFRCRLPDCPSPQTVALNQPRPGAIAVNATHVYWIAEPNDPHARIVRAAKDGSEPQGVVIASEQNQAASLVLDSTYVYWTDHYVAGTVQRCPLSGCEGAPTVLSTDQTYPDAIAVDGTHVYWLNSDAGELVGCLAESCTPTRQVLAKGLTFWGGGQTLAYDDHDIYWVAQGMPDRPYGAFPNATIYRLPK